MKPTYLGFEGPRIMMENPYWLICFVYYPRDVCGHYYVPAENKLIAVMYQTKQFNLSFLFSIYL